MNILPHNAKSQFRCAVALFLFLSLAGCKTLGERSIDNGFPGVTAAMDKPIVCLLFVHGIGGYSNDDPKHILDCIAKLPNMRVTSASHPVPLTGTNATLARQDFVDSANGHQLRTYTLDWEPVTVPVKQQYLAYDSDLAVTHTRLPINSQLRTSLLDGGIPDVVLYEGQFKPAIQAAVKSALQQMHQDIETRDDKSLDYEYVFVTWSLGSKIVFDCLAEPEGATTQPSTEPTEEKYIFNKIAEKTHSVYMLANQLPLLTLGDVKASEKTRAQRRPYKSLLSVAKQRKVATTHPVTSTHPASAQLSIVAFSDPNDLLSYPIPAWLESSPDATFSNVAISVATTAYYVPFVGWLWNPDTAHTAYGIEDDVVDLVLHGGKATVK